MKEEKKDLYKSIKPTEPSILREAVKAEMGKWVSVRDAKAHLSALLEWVAGGHEVTITSDGLPKARLIGAEAAKPRKVFQGMGDFLMKQPVHGGPGADELIRAERDSRP